MASGLMAGRSQARPFIAAAFALAAGVAIAYVDTRPGWDDTAVSGCLIAAVAAFAALGGLSPTLAAVLVAVPVICANRTWGVLLAIPFALAGAFGGALIRRLGGSREPAPPPCA